jgi:hypothetical protein
MFACSVRPFGRGRVWFQEQRKSIDLGGLDADAKCVATGVGRSTVDAVGQM